MAAVEMHAAAAAVAEAVVCKQQLHTTHGEEGQSLVSHRALRSELVRN